MSDAILLLDQQKLGKLGNFPYKYICSLFDYHLEQLMPCCYG